jgi:hypothetical protein
MEKKLKDDSTFFIGDAIYLRPSKRTGVIEKLPENWQLKDYSLRMDDDKSIIVADWFLIFHQKEEIKNNENVQN